MDSRWVYSLYIIHSLIFNLPRKLRKLRGERHFFDRAWVEEIDRLAPAIVAGAIGHAHKLRAHPKLPIRAENHRIVHETAGRLFGLPRAVKPAVQRFPGAMH